MSPNVTLCIGPAVDDAGRPTRCKLPARAEQCCVSHYRQLLRARERGELRAGADARTVLRPIRKGDGEQVSGITVSPRTAKALDAKGPTRYAAAQSVLEDWGRKSSGVERARRPRPG